MRGIVFHNDEKTHNGLIVGDGGKQYGFTRLDWIGNQGKEHDTVNFKVVGNSAKEIRVVTAL